MYLIRLATGRFVCFQSVCASICRACLLAVWPDLAIYWTLGNFLKPLATIKLPQYPPFLGNFCKAVKIIHFSSETIFGQLFIYIWRFLSGHTACLQPERGWTRSRGRPPCAEIFRPGHLESGKRHRPRPPSSARDKMTHRGENRPIYL